MSTLITLITLITQQKKGAHLVDHVEIEGRKLGIPAWLSVRPVLAQDMRRPKCLRTLEVGMQAQPTQSSHQHQHQRRSAWASPSAVSDAQA